jgi:phage shock protein C
MGGRAAAAHHGDMDTNTASLPTHHHDNSLAGARAWFAHKGLSRPRRGRLVAGVCASFADRFDVNPLVARLIAVVGVLTLSPLVYVALWVLMPEEPAEA